MDGSDGGKITLNLTPFIIAIIIGSILVFVVERIGSSRMGSGGGGGSHSNGPGGVGDVDISQIIERKTSDIRERRKREDAERALIHRIKIFGIAAGMALTLALVSLVNIIGMLMAEEADEDQGAIFFALIPFIIGTVLTIVFTIRFFQDRRTYELYYGPLFGKKS